ncbi:hypothetical protein ACEN2P_05335 [Pedobacter psychrotolerans]|uniref:hypothetical protein n=1 Tax=Pedobacter psychrotolerans TaxID=1843235 RepID=UPI003F9E7ABA
MASEKKNIKKEPALKSKGKVIQQGSSKIKTTIEAPESVDSQSDLFEISQIKAKKIVEEKREYSFQAGASFDPFLPIYIQIHANNIFRLFSSALISPQSGENQNMFSDIQSVNPTVLLLSNGFIARIEEKTALLEVTLTEDELFQLEVSNGVAVYRRPLPISRVKGILVENERVKSDMLNTSITADGGIIPEPLFSFFKLDHTIYHLPEVKPTIQGEALETKLFDKILGTFSFLANYNVLMSNRTNMIKTLPDHFFLAAKAINNNYKISLESDRVLNFYKILFRMNNDDQPPLQWLVRRMFEGSNFIDNDVVSFVDFISKSSKPEFLNESRDILHALMKSLERKQAIRNIPQLKQSDKFYLYLFSILRQYGNLNTEDKSISRADLPNLLFPAYGEYTFACLGYFYGYKAQRNFEERINLNDPFFAEVFDTEKRLNLKFKLNTILDLSLIESVYQYAFNFKQEINFPDYSKYPQVSSELFRRPSYIAPKYTLEGSTFLGKAIYSITKKSDIDQIERFLQHVDIIPAISVFGARCYRRGVKVESVTLREVQLKEPKYNYYFNKTDVLSAIRTGIIKAEEALKDIIFGLEEKEF